MQMKGRCYAKRAQRLRPAAMAAPGEVSRRGGSAAPAPTGPGPTASLSPRGARSQRGGSRGCVTPPRTFASRRRPTPSPCTRPGPCWRRGTWTATSTCEWGRGGSSGAWGDVSGVGTGGNRPSGLLVLLRALASSTRCWQVLVLLHRGGEPAALVFGASPQVVPGCGLLPGRAE